MLWNQLCDVVAFHIRNDLTKGKKTHTKKTDQAWDARGRMGIRTHPDNSDLIAQTHTWSCLDHNKSGLTEKVPFDPPPCLLPSTLNTPHPTPSLSVPFNVQIRGRLRGLEHPSPLIVVAGVTGCALLLIIGEELMAAEWSLSQGLRKGDKKKRTDPEEGNLKNLRALPKILFFFCLWRLTRNHPLWNDGAEGWWTLFLPWLIGLSGFNLKAPSLIVNQLTRSNKTNAMNQSAEIPALICRSARSLPATEA